MSWNIRRDPFTGMTSRHDGIDLPFGMNEPLGAFQDGTVTRIENDPTGYGWYIDIKHDDGTTGRYAHAGIINKGVGHRVKRGEEIGLAGSTGRSTGPHLHFEHQNQSGQPMDPRPFLTATGGRPTTQFADAQTAPTQNYGGPNMPTPAPQTQGGPPAGMPDYVRQAQGMIGNAQPSPELIAALTRNNQARGQNLPLALGAMLSRDQNMQKFGNTMYQDANDARNLVPLGEDGFVDPMTGKYMPNPVGENKKNQRVLEMSLRLAQQAEDAAARRAQSQQQWEVGTMLKQAMLGVAQQQADTAQTNANTAQGALDIKQNDEEVRRREEETIRDLIASDPNSPYKTLEDYRKNAGAERARAEEILKERVAVQGKMKQRQALMDEFARLNANNPTGDLYDAQFSNSPTAFVLNGDKQRMIQISNELQVAGVPAGQGAVSNLERQLFANVMVGLQYRNDANNKAYEASKRQMEFHADHTRFLQDYFQKFGHLNGADQAAANYLGEKYGKPGGGENGGSATNPDVDAALKKYPNRGAK